MDGKSYDKLKIAGLIEKQDNVSQHLFINSLDNKEI